MRHVQATLDLSHHLEHAAIERPPQGDQFIYHAPKGPHVRLGGVRLAAEDLRTHVVVGADEGVVVHGERVDVARRAQVADFHLRELVQENVPI